VVSRRRHRASVRQLTPEESGRRWDDFTLRHTNSGDWAAWLGDSWSFHLPLLARMMEIAPRGGRILEVGAGGGPSLLWLAARGYECVGIDYRAEVVAAARRNADRLGLDIRVEVGDAFDLSDHGGFDVVFSLGMIEHWERHESVRALQEQARAGRHVIAVIPTLNTRFTATITDERFYSPRELRAMFEEAGLTDIRSFAYGIAPTRSARISSLALPHAAFRLMQNTTGWTAMGQAAIGLSQSSAR